MSKINAKTPSGEGVIDGRTLRRRGRDCQIALKTTLAKREQLQRLAKQENKNLVEVFEEALDLYERSLHRPAGKIRKAMPGY